MKKKMYVVVDAGPGKRLKFAFPNRRAMNCFLTDVQSIGSEVMKKKMYVVVDAGRGKRLKFTFPNRRVMNCFFADVQWIGSNVLKIFKKLEAATQKRSS